jgi:hypothetical protein
MQQQEREQRTHALAVEGNVATVLDDRKRAENAKFDRDVSVSSTPEAPGTGVPVRARLEATATLLLPLFQGGGEK